MALETTTNRAEFAGNGVTTVFSFPYYFLAEADLKVYVRNNSTGVETLKTLTTHYTITGEGEEAGGSVTMLSAPSASETLIIFRDPTITQGTDFRENDSLPAEATEEAFDRAAMISQRLKDRVDRAVRLSDGFSPDFDPTLPTDLDDAADKIPLVNEDGDGWADAADWPSVTGVTAGMAASAAAAAASASAAATSASNAATSATAAALAETNAETAETNAETAETNAAASAAAAAASAAAVLAALPFRDVVYKTVADSPLTLTSSDVGKVFHLDCSGGAIAVNLPSIAALTGISKVITLIKSDSGSNKVTYTRNGTDTIEGATSDTLDTQGAGVMLVADTDGSPDDWTKVEFATAGGGGGVDLDLFQQADAPLESFLYNSQVYEFEDTLSQYLYGEFVVPDSYIAGNPISLKGQFFAPATSGNVLFKTVSTLIRAGTDPSSSTTNQRTSTNSAVSLSGSNDIDRNFTCDLTSSTGQINGVSVSPRDRIKFRIERDTATDTAAASAYLYKKGYEVTLR